MGYFSEISIEYHTEVLDATKNDYYLRAYSNYEGELFIISCLPDNLKVDLRRYTNIRNVWRLIQLLISNGFEISSTI